MKKKKNTMNTNVWLMLGVLAAVLVFGLVLMGNRDEETIRGTNVAFEMRYPKAIGTPSVTEDLTGMVIYFDGPSPEALLWLTVQPGGVNRGGILMGVMLSDPISTTVPMGDDSLIINRYVVTESSEEFLEYEMGKELIDASYIRDGSEIVYMKNSNPLSPEQFETVRARMIQIAKTMKI
jgi:hypothetical protein